MSEKPRANHDRLDVAIHAFQQMPVPERPPDAQLLARVGRPKWRFLMHALAASAAAVVLLGGVALYRWNSRPPEPVQVARTGSPGKGREVADPPREKREVTREGLGSFDEHVTAAQVVVVATALDAAVAPPRRPGDLPENLLRFQVKRVLKGRLADKVITTRTPTAAGEFIGKDWIILLPPEYMARKHQYGSHVNIKLEPTVQAILARDRQ